jgi:translation initiation factor eIF-2B subunit delta
MSNAELKAKVKAEKAARRAQVKEAKAVPIPPIAQTGAAGGDGKGGGKSGKGKQDAQLQSPGGAPGQGRSGGHQRRPSGMGQRPSIVAAVVVEKDVRSDIPDCFSHIPMAKRIATSQAHKDVHPAALALGQQMATFTVRDSIARLKCTLLAFKQVRIL